jgi:nucleotide-binding universal stress UspA family protein
MSGPAWRTLLVPHDYSPCADRALELACQLATLHGAKLVLLHVTHLPPGVTADALLTDPATGTMQRVDDHTRAQALRELDERAAAPRGLGLAVELRAAVGDIPTEVLRAAREVGADLLVMGTHGRTGLAHLLVGSITEKVLRESPVPVLTVRAVG